MNSKRILIVDDEPSIRRILKRGLDNLDKGYHVITAADGYEALKHIKRQPFDLIVTDYKMAGLDGLTLLEAIKSIQPDARVVLMTAYGSDKVEARAHRLNAYRYLVKPLELDDFRQMVQEALDDLALSTSGMLVLSDQRYKQAAAILKKLREDIGAHTILLVNTLGQTIIRQAEDHTLPLNEIVTLLSEGLATLIQAGKTLDNAQNTIHLIYRESEAYHLYGINVGESLLMIILIANTEFSSPLGSVWYYARRIVQELRTVIGDVTNNAASNTLDEQFSHSLESELDSLLGLGSQEEESDLWLQSALAGGEMPPKASENPHPRNPSTAKPRLLTWDEAIHQGLLSSEQEEIP